MSEFIKFIKSIFKWAMIISFGGFLFGIVALMTIALGNQYNDWKKNKPLEEVFLFALECQEENGFKDSFVFKVKNRPGNLTTPLYLYRGIDQFVGRAKKNPKSLMEKSNYLSSENLRENPDNYTFYYTEKFEEKAVIINRTSLEMIQFYQDGSESESVCKLISEKQFNKNVKEALKNLKKRI